MLALGWSGSVASSPPSSWGSGPQAYELQVANGGRWASVYSTSGNNLQRTQYVGPTVSASALRIRMTMAGAHTAVALCLSAVLAFAHQPHPTLGSSSGHAL